jgi:hypothetical protein
MGAEFYMVGTDHQERNATHFAFLFSRPRWKCGTFLVYIFEQGTDHKIVYQDPIRGVIGRRSIGGRVPVLLKLDRSRPNLHMWYSVLRHRTVSIVTLTLARSSSRFNNAVEVR